MDILEKMCGNTQIKTVTDKLYDVVFTQKVRILDNIDLIDKKVSKDLCDLRPLSAFSRR